MPLFANPAAFWLLLGVPVILAIHFLQQKSRVVRTSAWFLIEKLAPDSKRGRTWDRIRSSRQLWLQLAAVLLGTWVLATPRWVRAESAQTVSIVLDASASMEAFREAALAAAEKEMNAAEGLATRTTWIIMSTDARQPALYRGTERAAASASLADWSPTLGEHDTAPALRLARGLAGITGRTLFITDSKRKTITGQRTVGVGKPIGNVGFAGLNAGRDGGAVTWRALVRNHSSEPETRSWHAESSSGASAPQSLQLEPGALKEISGRIPEGSDEITLVLAADAFALDDRLPIRRPVPKPLPLRIDGSDAAADFFRRVAADVEGVRIGSAASASGLKIARLTSEAADSEPAPGIYYPATGAEKPPEILNRESLTPERSPLVTGVSWQAWLGTGPYGFRMREGDIPLLWQAGAPLAFIRLTPEGGRKLMLAFDWDASNASRLPAMVLLIWRFLEEERERQPAPYAANFDTSDRVSLRGLADGTVPLQLAYRPGAGAVASTSAIPAVEVATLRAPARPGFFDVRNGENVLVRGAAQFGDSRQGNFKEAETFESEQPAETKAALERNTRADPLAPLWLALLAAVLLATWWERRSRAPSSPGFDAAGGQAPYLAETKS